MVNIVEEEARFFQFSSSFDPDLLAHNFLLATSRKKLLFTLKFQLEQLLPI
jgi:hypothetical protein